MLGALVAPATAALGAPAAPAPPQASPPPTPADNQVAEIRLLELMNRERAGAGLAPLAPRDDVIEIARRHSERMAAAGDIWHNDDFFSRESHKRLGAKSLGENVALNRSVDDAHARLMNSPGHRANIMSPRFSVVGVGVAADASGIFYITEGFVEPGNPPAPPPAEAEAAGSTPSAPLVLVAAVRPKRAPARSSAPVHEVVEEAVPPLIDDPDAAVLSRGGEAMQVPSAPFDKPTRPRRAAWIAAALLLGTAVASTRRLVARTR